MTTGHKIDGLDVAAARIKSLDRQSRFAMAVTLTDVAKEAQRIETARLPQVFDRPNPFTARAIDFAPASMARLESAVFVRDGQAEYLALHEDGGVRTPQPGKPVNVPVKVRLNQYGNIPKRFWNQVAQLAIRRPYMGAQTFSVRTRKLVTSYGGGMFVATAGNPRTKHLPPGIYERPKVGRRRKKRDGTGTKGKLERAGGKMTGLKLLVAFEDDAVYVPRFEFRRSVTDTVRATFAERFRANLRSALDTARR